MHLKWFASLGVLLLLVAGGLFYLSKSSPETTSGTKDFGATKENSQFQSLAEDFSQKKPVERLIAFYEKESKRIGQVDENPALTQKRIESVASVLDPQELLWLKKQTMDRSLEGDARFFAVYMLALNASDSSLDLLGDIASQTIPQTKNKRVMELEVQIRAQAIEGIGRARSSQRARDVLLDIMNKQENTFLQDRTHRSLYQWETGKPLEKQDKEALSKVLYGK